MGEKVKFTEDDIARLIDGLQADEEQVILKTEVGLMAASLAYIISDLPGDQSKKYLEQFQKAMEEAEGQAHVQYAKRHVSNAGIAYKLAQLKHPDAEAESDGSHVELKSIVPPALRKDEPSAKERADRIAEQLLSRIHLPSTNFQA